MHTPALYSSKYHATRPRSENVQFSAVLLIRRTYPPTSPEEKRALENPDRPIFYALDAARALIATWRQRYNGVSAVLLLGDPARHRTLTVIRACQAAVIADDGDNRFVRKMPMGPWQEVTGSAQPRAGSAPITVSIVSHGHAHWVQPLVSHVLACPEVAHLILTRNIAEDIALPSDSRLAIVDNAIAKGFGANHNGAFRECRTPYFCVLNPDVSWTENPFPGLLRCLEATRAAVAGPLVIGPDGVAADSMRRFPSLLSLMRKAVGGDDGRYQTTPGAPCFLADWVAGMCMLFRSADFAALGGFDEAFFLYYEDVDICARLWGSGRSVAACPQSLITHTAQRASRHNTSHTRWHLASMALYFWKHRGRLPRSSNSPPQRTT